MRNITVVMPTHLWCYREILKGIGAFANAKATWRVQYFTPRDSVFDLLRQMPPEGLLLGHTDPSVIIELTTGALPVTVGVCGHNKYARLPVAASIDVDEKIVGEMAAEHFLRKKHVNYAFVGFESATWSDGRRDGFQQRLGHSGGSAACLTPHWEPAGGWRTTYPNTRLVPFLNSLPKPLAVMACNDIRGREIIEACRHAGLRVPEDVAVIGVDDDPLDCQLCHPPLSSVSIPWERIGYLAASHLDLLLEGKPVPRHTAVPPTVVVERQSTDSVAISDPDVASALLYIREHAHVSFSITDLLRTVPIGRRTLEKRFRTLLGRSLLDEIRRVHTDRAAALLVQTDLPVADIAALSGFDAVPWFSTSFRKTLGVSPLAYRKKFRR